MANLKEKKKKGSHIADPKHKYLSFFCPGPVTVQGPE